MMIGLDMLKRHRCCIDLAANVLKIGEDTAVPFLSENELPESAKMPNELAISTVCCYYLQTTINLLHMFNLVISSYR